MSIASQVQGMAAAHESAAAPAKAETKAAEGNPASTPAQDGNALQGGQPDETKPHDLSRELALIHRERKRVKEQEKSLAERLKKAEDFEQKVGKAKESPFSVLEAHGLSLDDLIKAKLSEGEPPSAEDRVKTVEEKLQALEKEKAEFAEASKREAEQKRNSEEINAFRGAIESHVKANVEQSELVSANDGIDLVMQICAQAIQEDPDAYKTRQDAEKLIPRVVGMVEDQLNDQLKSYLEKVGTTKKGKALLQALNLAAPEAVSKDIQKTTGAIANSEPQITPTLTNKAVSPAQPEQSGRLLSRDESLKRLAAQLQSQWGSQR